MFGLWCDTFPAPFPCKPLVEFDAVDNRHVFRVGALDEAATKRSIDLTDTKGHTHTYRIVSSPYATADGDVDERSRGDRKYAASSHEEDTRDASSYCGSSADTNADHDDTESNASKDKLLYALGSWRLKTLGPLDPLADLERYHTWDINDNRHLLDVDGKVSFPGDKLDDDGVCVIDTIGRRFLIPTTLRHPTQVWNDTCRIRFMENIVRVLFKNRVELALPPDLSAETIEHLRVKNRRRETNRAFKRNLATKPPKLKDQGGEEVEDSEEEGSVIDERFWKAVAEYQAGTVTAGQASKKYGIARRHFFPYIPRIDADDLHRRRLLAAKDIQEGSPVQRATKKYNLTRTPEFFSFTIEQIEDEEEREAMNAAIADVIDNDMPVATVAKQHDIKLGKLARRIPAIPLWERQLRKHKARDRAARQAAAAVDAGECTVTRATVLYEVTTDMVTPYLSNIKTPGQEADERRAQKRRLASVQTEYDEGAEVDFLVHKYNLTKHEASRLPKKSTARRPRGTKRLNKQEKARPSEMLDETESLSVADDLYNGKDVEENFTAPQRKRKRGAQAPDVSTNFVVHDDDPSGDYIPDSSSDDPSANDEYGTDDESAKYT
ncbi:hypothetical protein N0V92_000246 [Colletotrichum tropicale]|nr:hypothetical protein N0V92_000246 [Colletotrichum tropicale]